MNTVVVVVVVVSAVENSEFHCFRHATVGLGLFAAISRENAESDAFSTQISAVQSGPAIGPVWTITPG